MCQTVNRLQFRAGANKTAENEVLYKCVLKVKLLEPVFSMKQDTASLSPMLGQVRFFLFAGNNSCNYVRIPV